MITIIASQRCRRRYPMLGKVNTGSSRYWEIVDRNLGQTVDIRNVSIKRNNGRFFKIIDMFNIRSFRRWKRGSRMILEN